MLALVLGLVGTCEEACALEPGSVKLTSASLSQLHATEGVLKPGKDGRLLIEEPKVRAVVPNSLSSVAELRFTYLGATTTQLNLASGELRQQVGLKLRAQDGCNVVYVMWRQAPTPGLVVSVKYNPHEHSSLECGNRGYTTIQPRQSQPVPLLMKGVPHTLHADLEQRELRVIVDDAIVWEGELSPQANTFDGPVGLRTDNGRFELELLAHMP
jgi:hypothetical protein